MGFYENFLAELEKAAYHRYKNPNQLAVYLGVETNLISRWLSRDRVPKATTMGEVLDKLGASLIFPEQDRHEIVMEMRKKNLTVLEVHAAAGAGAALEDQQGEPKFHIAVPHQYLRPNLQPLLISGNSMEPTILNQAVVGVNLDYGEIVQGQIYAVRLPYEGIVVKRLFLDHEKRLFVLRSDNKNGDYPDIKISFDDSAAFIHGLVVWVLQSYEKIMI